MRRRRTRLPRCVGCGRREFHPSCRTCWGIAVPPEHRWKAAAACRRVQEAPWHPMLTHKQFVKELRELVEQIEPAIERLSRPWEDR